LAITNICK